jgi:hypothetical protein
MTRAMADELLYNEAQNEVIFIKFLDTRAGAPETGFTQQQLQGEDERP